MGADGDSEPGFPKAHDYVDSWEGGLGKPILGSRNYFFIFQLQFTFNVILC